MKEGGKRKIFKSSATIVNIISSSCHTVVAIPRHLVILRLIRGIQFALISGYAPRRSYIGCSLYAYS